MLLLFYQNRLIRESIGIVLVLHHIFSDPRQRVIRALDAHNSIVRFSDYP